MACLMQTCAVKGARHTPCLCFQSSLNEVIIQAYQRCSLPACQMQEPEEALVTAAGGHTELSQASDEQLLAWVSLLSAPDQGSIACAMFPSSSGMIDMFV